MALAYSATTAFAIVAGAIGFTLGASDARSATLRYRSQIRIRPVDGAGRNIVGELIQVREVTLRYGREAAALPRVMGPGRVAEFVRTVVVDDAVEHFVALYLDGRHTPIAWRLISKGTATAALVHPREIFQAGVMLGAVAVVIAHTHPSGQAMPSAEDKSVTQRLVNAGELVGIRVLDHVVVGHEENYSFDEEGAMPSPSDAIGT